MSGSSLFYFQNKVNNPKTFTNCVFVDPDALTNNINTIRATVASNIVFKGYNVIQGTINGSWTGVEQNHPTDIILAQDAASPLHYEDGIWKVVVDDGDGPAYRHLPANISIDGITFPKYDLAGAEIDYAKATHSGAWQTLYGDEPGETGYPAEVSIRGATDRQEVLCDVYGEPKSLKLLASVLPNGSQQGVAWQSSDESVATIDADGNVAISFTDGPDDREVTFTATSVAVNQAGQTVSGSITIVVKPFVHLQKIELAAETVRSLIHKRYGLEFDLKPVFYPENATNRKFTWEFDNPDIIEVYKQPDGKEGIIGKKAGEVKVKIVAEDGQVANSCTFIFHDPYYKDVEGAFLLTEGNYPGSGLINFLYEETGDWDYGIYQTVNNYDAGGRTPRHLGITTAFGAIYGDNFYFVSKQNPRLVVADAVTLKQHKEFHNIYAEDNRSTSLDGRAFLGVDENTGYVGTASGISVVKFDELLAAPGDMTESSVLIDAAVKELPYTMITGTESDGNLYSGQVGAMRRVGDRVFAVQQNKGLLVINALTHQLETVLTGYNYSTLAQSMDGFLWSGTTKNVSTGELDDEPSNILARINPYNLEVTEVPLPAGITGPGGGWGAWQADAFMGSAQKNQLYWTNGAGGFGGGAKIYQYDIATGVVKAVFNTADHPLPAEFPNSKWAMYGTSFGIHPVTDEVYVWITLFNLQASNNERLVWEIHKVNPHTGEDVLYPISRSYWWPSMWIWQDNHAPVISDALAGVSLAKETRIYLGDKVTDTDNMDAAIVKSILPGYDQTLITARIWHDSLIVAPVKTVLEDTPTTLTLKANSNGKVVTKEITVTVEASAPPAVPVTGVTLNHVTAQLPAGQTLQLTATVLPANATNKAVTWTSSQPAIASVSASGQVTAHIANGTAVIVASTADGGFTATCTVTTKPEGGTVVNPFELTQKILSLYPGQTVVLSLTAPQHFNVTWSSTNPSVASVSSTGVVTSHAAGTAKIIAGDVAQGRSDECAVTVTALPDNPPAESIALSASSLLLTQGETATLQATLSAGLSGQAIQWTTSDGNVANVTSAGLVVALTPGTAVIRAAAGGYSAACTVTVAAPRQETSVDNVGEHEARLSFTKAADAAYYLVHLYKKDGLALQPALTLKVTPDGSVELRSSAGNSLIVPLQYLSSGTLYIVEIETLREAQGKAEVIRTETTAFTTKGAPTGIEQAAVAPATVFCHNGTLYVRNLESYRCLIISAGGQAMRLFTVNSPDESHPLALPSGLYILSAEKDGSRKTFKLVIM